jgi:N-acetyl-alpha-D-muramate 1-phosphate uridylyltransferase
VAILAGGLGTRLGASAAGMPKGMAPVAGRPFLEHVVALLAHHGARRIVVCRAHLGEVIERGLGDGGRFGLRIDYSDEGPEPIGTAGALRRALPLLGDRFLAMYGDTYLRVDYAEVARAHAASGLAGLMTVLRNRGRWGQSNAVYRRGRVLAYDKRRPPPGAQWIDYGVLGLTPRALGDEADLAGVLSGLAARGELAGLPVTRRFYEIGTPDALAETERFLTRRGTPAPPPAPPPAP